MSLRAWLVAARPKTLLAAVAPVLVGGGLAAADDVFRTDALAVTLAAALLLNIAVNFANDASDAARGTDTPDRIGPPRAVAGGLLTARQVWVGTWVALGPAAAAGVYLTWISGWPIIVIGASAIVAALAYSGGPWPYGYRGLGEVFVFAYFGPAAVVGSRFAHDATAPADAWLASIPVGLLAAAILVVNNVRDIETDRTSGKRTLAVILGRRRTRRLHAGLVLGAFALIALFGGLAWVPRGVLGALAALPMVPPLVLAVMRETAGPPLIKALVANARLHALVGLLMGAGAAIAG